MFICPNCGLELYDEEVDNDGVLITPCPHCEEAEGYQAEVL